VTVNEMITRYGLTLMDDGRIKAEVSRMGRTKQEQAANSDIIRANKPAIVAELTTRRDAEIKEREESAARLATNVPGLDALRDARNQWDMYHDAFNRAIDRDDVRMPNQPTVDAKALTAQYPVAAAYLKAEAYEYASNYAKSSAGRKAKQAIANGMDYTEALAQMEDEWAAHCDAHKWD